MVGNASSRRRFPSGGGAARPESVTSEVFPVDLKSEDVLNDRGGDVLVFALKEPSSASDKWRLSWLDVHISLLQDMPEFQAIKLTSPQSYEILCSRANRYFV